MHSIQSFGTLLAICLIQEQAYELVRYKVQFFFNHWTCGHKPAGLPKDDACITSTRVVERLTTVAPVEMCQDTVKLLHSHLW